MTSKALELKPNQLIGAVASELKANPTMKPPAWVASVKSGAHAERLPESPDFWYVRCASLLRTLFVGSGTVGVRRLRSKYGGRTGHTVARSHHKPAGGKIIRVALQQLEQAGYVKKEKVGRTISANGKKLLEKAAKSVAG